MDAFDVLPTLLPSFAGMVAAVVLIVYLLSQNKTPTQQLAVRGPGGRYLPLGAPGAPISFWQAQWFEGVDPLGTFGTATIVDGNVEFALDKTTVPQWRYPVRDVRARHRGTFHFGRANLKFWLPDGRELGLIVSREHINRWVDNDFKSLRQISEAHTFLAILAANGARILTK